MSLIDRAEPRRESAIAAMDPADQAARGPYFALYQSAFTNARLVCVSYFPDRAIVRKFLTDLACETKAWCAPAPTHMIHLDGAKFAGPLAVETS